MNPAQIALVGMADGTHRRSSPETADPPYLDAAAVKRLIDEDVDAATLERFNAIRQQIEADPHSMPIERIRAQLRLARC